VPVPLADHDSRQVRDECGDAFPYAFAFRGGPCPCHAYDLKPVAQSLAGDYQRRSNAFSPRRRGPSVKGAIP
jgi:hypothetical protein